MPSAKLPNYIRTHRKRAHLTQNDVAFLIGAKSSAHICRHERLQQTPNLQTLLAYEILFRTPVRNLFSGVHQDVEHKLMYRIRLLIQNLAKSGHSRVKARKIEILNDFLREREFLQRA
ncbi:MAG TPA: helix-turn-helix transcriptional regulator [Candidatus Limnocylindrales bacterium]|nr:helix-turn-helix transcriptional regulator [Candidatus Limnocylindrales bacterium]